MYEVCHFRRVIRNTTKIDQPIYIHPEDGFFNVCRNVGQLSKFDEAHAWKPMFYIPLFCYVRFQDALAVRSCHSHFYEFYFRYSFSEHHVYLFQFYGVLTDNVTNGKYWYFWNVLKSSFQRFYVIWNMCCDSQSYGN